MDLLINVRPLQQEHQVVGKACGLLRLKHLIAGETDCWNVLFRLGVAA